MYETQIQTTLSLLGHLVFVEYRMTKEWAVEWFINLAAYPSEDATTDSALMLLESLLRTNYSDKIEQQLLSEFEGRQYAEEQAEAAKLMEEDIPF